MGTILYVQLISKNFKILNSGTSSAGDEFLKHKKKTILEKLRQHVLNSLEPRCVCIMQNVIATIVHLDSNSNNINNTNNLNTNSNNLNTNRSNLNLNSVIVQIIEIESKSRNEIETLISYLLGSISNIHTLNLKHITDKINENKISEISEDPDNINNTNNNTNINTTNTKYPEEDSLKKISENLTTTKQILNKSLNRIVQRGQNIDNIGILASKLEKEVRNFRKDVKNSFSDSSFVKMVVVRFGGVVGVGVVVILVLYFFFTDNNN